MGKTNVVYLISGSCCGLVGLALIITSYSTQFWVSALIRSSANSSRDESQANHGLFTGTLDRQILGSTSTYTIYAACLMSEGVCAWSCLDTDEKRLNEVEILYQGGRIGFSCTPRSSSKQLELVGGPTQKVYAAGERSDDFMPAGLWLTAIIFISLALTMNMLALGFNCYNIVYNPIEIYASPLAITVYYGTAACSTLLTLILWGAQYAAYTSGNIAILDTLTHVLQSQASLGWSYFLLIPAELAQLMAMGAVYYREYIINKKQSDQVIKADDSNNDANTFLY